MTLLSKRLAYKPFTYDWAYDAYLTQQKIHWIPEEVPLSEDVRDWNFKLTEEEKNFLTQIFRFFTQADCYSDDTEVLTNNGWKLFKDLTTEDKVAQVNNNRELSFIIPSSYIEKPYKGVLHGFKEKRGRIDLLVTPNHKMYYEYKGEIKSDLAKDIKFYQGVKTHTACSTTKFKNSILTPIEKLSIAFQADGNLKKDVDGSRLGYLPVRFGFKKIRKVVALMELLMETDIKYELTKDEKDYYNFYLEWPIDSKHYLTKDFSWVNIEKISSATAQNFIEALSLWDCHIDKWNNITYSNTNKSAAEIVQIISILAGYSCNFSELEDNRSDKFSSIFNLTIRKNYEPVDGQSIAREQYTTNYSGNVYCVTVPDGNLVVRRNNSVSICGNCDVAQGYRELFNPLFGGNPEIAMMLSSFTNMEGIHIDAYSKLIDTVGMPESEYLKFLEYSEMVDKHNYLDTCNVRSKEEIAKALAVYSGFTEGLQLFSSFIMLLNFTRYGKMKGMGQIVTWSIRDETLHVDNMIKLFRTFIQENIEIWTDEFKKDLYQIARDMVDLEFKFIDMAFEMGGVNGLEKEDVKEYVKYIADRRLLQLGLKTNYGVKDNPLPWVDEMLNLGEHANFFETRATEYSKGSITGDWSKIWASRKN